MNVQEVISVAFVMGAVGSLHCVGMCGPIAMALPLGDRSNNGRLLAALIYNSGRVLTYIWLGLVLGLAGDYLISPQIQSTVSIVFGILICVFLFLPKRIKNRGNSIAPVQRFFLQLRKALGSLLSKQNNSSLFGIGMLNGLLPCGMIYLALGSSFLTGSAVKGGIFMASFGLGTFPLMMAAVFFGSYLNQTLRFRMRKLVPVFLFVMAALLVLRGLNLGIPYLSPSLPVVEKSSPILCH